jgi:hypothetical protein
MIVRLGDAATDAANAQDQGFISTVVAQQPIDIAAVTPPASTTDYTSVTSALDSLLYPGAYSGSLPVGSPTINSSGQVVPSTSTSGASGVGGALSNLVSNLFGGSSNKSVAPVGYSYNSAGQLVPSSTILGLSTNTINLVLFGVVGVLVVVAISGGKKR